MSDIENKHDVLEAQTHPVKVDDTYEVDAFGVHQQANANDYVEFRTMGWITAGGVATAEAIALGLLSFPSVYLRLGMVGGILSTVGFGILAYVTGCMMIDFKMRHMGVMNFGDAGGVMFGRLGQQWFGWGMVIKSIGLAGSHVNAGGTALNVFADGKVCLVAFGVVITVVSIFMSVNREWHKLHWMSWLSLLCILIASLITMIAAGIQSPSVLIKKGVPIAWHATPTNPNLADIIGGLTNIIFGYGGNMAVFSICSEMRRPQDFKKSLLIVQGAQIVSYTIVGSVLYALGGQYTTSPALGMTTHTVKIVAYAIAFVTIMVSGILAVNVGAKYLYVQWLRNSALLTSKSWRAWLYWMGIITGMWIAGFIFSQLIPFFNQLLTIVSSLFTVWFAFGYVGVLWFWDVHPSFSRMARDAEPRAIDSTKKRFEYAVAVFSIILSLVITPLGLYSAAIGIKAGYAGGTFKHPFSC